MITLYRKNLLDFTTPANFNIGTNPTGINSWFNRNNSSGYSIPVTTSGGTTRFNAISLVSINELSRLDKIIMIGVDIEKGSTISTVLHYGVFDPPGTSTVANRTLTVNMSATDEDGVYIATIPETSTYVGQNVFQAFSIQTNTLASNPDYRGDSFQPRMTQLILTRSIGQFQNQLNVESIVTDVARKSYMTATGKTRVVLKEINRKIKLTKNSVTSKSDLDLHERIYNSKVPFLYDLSGGNQTQFRAGGGIRRGYGVRDISLMLPSNMYNPRYNDGRWNQGVDINIELVEVD